MDLAWVQRSRDPADKTHSSTPGSPIAQGTRNEALDALGHLGPAGHSRLIVRQGRVQWLLSPGKRWLEWPR